ncbi:venom phosphodiesterase-like isoform X3 [Apostichopus japonicus]|uniref:venom phosphodiesterase-like isoform X3 n=1 Tax=Stichopus japonicus TaxID=307972 RepID=UPI003AB82411
MSRNNALEMLRNPRPYPHGENGATPPRAKQPNRALDELRKPQPYPTASQPAQRPPAQSQPARNTPPNASQPRPPNNQHGNLRNPRPYPSASQPQGRPKTPQSTSRPPAAQSYGPPAARPPSASQPRPSPTPAQGKPTVAPQKKKPRVAVSSGAPKPYQPPRQTMQHVTPPVRTMPPSASQPQPQKYQPRPTPTQTPTSAAYPPRTTTPASPYSTAPSTPRATTPRATTPRATTPVQQSPPVLTTEPPTPQHTRIQPPEYEPSYTSPTPTYNQPNPTYRNPPPMETNPRLTPTSRYDESDVPDYDRESNRSIYARSLLSPESDIESGPPGSDRTPSPLPEKKDFDDEVDTHPHRMKTTSKSRLADDPGSDRRKIYVRKMAIIFMVILAIALALGLSLSNRSVDYSGAFAITLGQECNMVCEDPAKNGYSRRSTLMIALDGFRPEFMNDSWREIIPNIHRLAECGSVATKMEPSYPSTTYPNLYTLVTGLYPTIHGVISDYLERDGIAGAFDPRNNPQSLTLQNPGWYNGKPIWQIAKEQGVITGSHSWIGNTVQEQSIGGFNVDPNPHYYVQHNPDIDFHARIQSALNWFTLPSNKAKFVNIYMEEPGNTITQHGVSSDQVKTALEEVDDAIGLFMENLIRDDVTGCFDIVIVSTNGHLDVSCENTTYFDSILPNTLFYDSSTHGMNSMGFITPTAQSPTDSDTVEELVTKLRGQNRQYDTYTLDTVPPKYHFYNKNRHEAALVIMDDWQTFASNQQNFETEMCTGARGGYSPSNPEMKGVLIGFGPSFKENFTRMEGFSNVEVYNLITELIDVHPEKNNGTHGVLNDLLLFPEVPLTNVADDSFFDPESSLCTFPTLVSDKNDKRDQADTGCQCSDDVLDNLGQQVTINQKDELLDISVGEAEIFIREVHAPFGAPGLIETDGAAGGHYCQLVQNNYMTIFENKLSIPLYVAYQLRQQSSQSELLRSCYRYDVRLSPESSPKCRSYNSANIGSLPDDMQMAFLLQQPLAHSLDDEFNILITSNIVPMWKSFVDDVWSQMVNQLRSMASDRDILVVAGPAFDTNRDGTRDSYQDIAFRSYAWVEKTPVPTHYYLVVTRCQDATQSVSLCPVEDLETVAYIFPHTKETIRGDSSIQDFMRTYQASVLDVERISGTFFFKSLAESNNEDNLKSLLALKMSTEPF